MDKLKGRKIAVFDLEIKKPVDECVKGWSGHDEMGVSCLCLYDYLEGRYRVFDDNSKYRCIEILNTYEYVVGYNTINFDWKVILACWKFPLTIPSRISKDFDIYKEMCDSGGRGGKLNQIAQETISMSKIGEGSEAPKLYQQSRFAEVVDYCLEDVRIEKTLFEFVVNNGYVIRNGQQIPIRFSL